MKKLLLISALMASSAMQAQDTEKVTFYWPGQRVETLTDGQQYFIYNTAYFNGDRSVFLYSNGNALKTKNVSPKDFVTTDKAFLFTTNKPENPNHETHWYLNCIHGIVGHGGQTNNTETRDIYIAPWWKNGVVNDEVSRSTDTSSEDENGAIQNPNEVNTKVWAITSVAGVNTNSDFNYAWNGESAGDNSWVRWTDAHPYAFYTIESKEIDEAAYVYSQELTAQNGKLGKIAFNLQKAFGLVQDGTKYYSNYKEATEGTYEALVDGNDGTYFHSAYNNGGTDGVDPKHYLRAELSSETNQFYFITKRRTTNNNNRPTSILIEGSNSGNDDDYTTITTVSSLPTEANDYYYFSEKITANVAYKYIRFTPQATNTSSRFFTYSEFYVISATAEVDNAMAAIKGLYDCKEISMKDDNFESSFLTAGQALDTQDEAIAFFIAKDEANKIIAANQNNTADDPQLGQYPTEAYTALQNAVNTCTTSAELETAIKTFKFSINAPVFLINGAGGGSSYSTIGKSIYYNPENTANPLYWNKATNKYDKSMLWKFAGLTTTTPELNTTYSAMNLSEDVYLWNVENMQITQPSDPENGPEQILIKTEGQNNPLHADSHGWIVRWGTFTANSASAWTIEYVGESKVIEGIDEDQLAAYAELQTLIAECTPFKDKIGTGLNQFTSANLLTALATAEEVAKTDIYSNPGLNVTEARDNLKAAKEALTINQPETGKYYRIKSVANNKYISSKPVADGRQSLIDNPKDPSTIYYLSDDYRLTNSIALNLGENSHPAKTDLGTTFEFLINNNGYYMIKSTERVEPLYPHYDNGDLLSYDFTSGNYADKIANAWILEEVGEEENKPMITKNITAEYATLAAPVSLVIPEGIKAYTAQVNEQKAILSEITGDIIPAGTAVVLQKTGTENEYEFTFDATAAVQDENNNLVGVYAETTIPTDTKAYILAQPTGKKIGFYLLNATDRTIAANKAYLMAPAEATGIKAFTFDFGGTTGIENTEAITEEAEEYYDLQGRRVINPTKGIYVTKSGKKVLFTK